MCPDFHYPIFQQDELNDYDPSTFKCRAEPDELTRGSQIEIRGRLQGNLINKEDRTFHLTERNRPVDYHSEYVQCSEQNPLKWFEIGITFENDHAAIIIHDITGTETDEENIDFQYLGMPKKCTSFDEGDVRRLHLKVTEETGDRSYYDLYYDALKLPREFQRYYSVCRLRTTDGMIKYIAGKSFPLRYRQVASDCATFAHRFLIETLTCLRAENHINENKFNSVVRNLVEHNHITDGAIGETEGVSRRSETLGESGGAAAESYAAIAPRQGGRRR